MRTTRRRRLLFWGGLLTIGSALVVVALIPSPLLVDLAAVDRGPLMVTLDHEGRTRVHDRFVVSAPVAGRVLRIDLEPGDRVVAHATVVATFLPADAPWLDARTRAEVLAREKAAEAAVTRARAERDATRTQRDFAAAELRRVQALADERIVSAQERQAAEATASERQQALDAAESALRMAEHELEAARAARLEPGTVAAHVDRRAPALVLRAPVSGVVLRRLRESEAVVPQGEPLMEIGDTAGLEVIADYLSTDAVRMRPGMPAIIDQWGGATPLRGRVRRVEPAGFLKISALGVEEQRVWVVIAFEDPRAAWQALGDGYRVQARIVTWEHSDVVRVPTSALFRQGQGWAVYVLENRRAATRRVEIGERNGAAAEVRSGLRPGDQVVVHPPDTITDGVRIAPRGQ